MSGRIARRGKLSRRADGTQVKLALDAKAISRKRAECMREIERLRGALGPTPFVEKAHRLLLPRYWASASWKARADILKAVEWLIGMSAGAGSTML